MSCGFYPIEYVAKRIVESKAKPEIIYCFKCYITREIYQVLREHS